MSIGTRIMNSVWATVEAAEERIKAETLSNAEVILG
jgi:hypothetical protein